jgi:hypothetical protein
MFNRLQVGVVSAAFYVFVFHASLTRHVYANQSATLDSTTSTQVVQPARSTATAFPRQRGGLIPANERSPENQERLRQFRERINRKAEAIKRGERIEDTTSTASSPPKVPIPFDLMLPGADIAPLSR